MSLKIIKSITKKIFKTFNKCTKKIKKLYKQNKYIGWYYKTNIIEKTVLIESKHGDDLAGNMFYILSEIVKNYKDYSVTLVITKKSKSKIQNMLKSYNLSAVNFVYYNSFPYHKALTTANYLFNDTSFSTDYIKKDGQIYTNTWHGTPFKMMGKDVKNRVYGMGNIKRNFLMCDYLVYPSYEMREKMMSAYGLNHTFKGEVLNCGYPRNSIFFDKEKASEVKEKYNLSDKKVYVYMPTWRGIMTNIKVDEQKHDIQEKMLLIDGLLNDDQVLYVKMHVLASAKLDFKNYKHIKVFPSDIEAYEFLNSADVLITDYSSVFYDFANTGKKIVLFTYDEEEYLSDRGFYYDINALPFPKVKTVKDLADELNKPKQYDDSKFKKCFCTYDNQYCAENVVRYILKGEDTNAFEVMKSNANSKTNTLIYSSILRLNGLTTSLLSLMGLIDKDKENIDFCFRSVAMKKFPMNITRAPDFVDFFPLCSGFCSTFSEFFAYLCFNKFNFTTQRMNHLLDRFYKREVKRFFGNAKYDKVIHYTGYEPATIAFLQRMDAKTAVLVHNDMVKELKGKANNHKLTLVEAYNNYDKVVPVSQSAYDSVIKIANPPKEKIVLLENTFDYNRVRSLMKEDLRFDDVTVSNVSEKSLKAVLEKDATKFINIGRFSPEKGQERLIDAFEQYFIKNPNSYLIIIGGYGPLYKTLLQKIEKSKCPNNIIIIKDVSNPMPILKKCDLFILSSLYEALGLVLLEANECGVPTISTSIGGTREFMQRYGGYLVENSTEGILQGMYDYKEGKVHCMNFDADEYNEAILDTYYKMFD